MPNYRTREPITVALENLKEACLEIQTDSNNASLWQAIKESLEEEDLEAVRAFALADFILVLLGAHEP